jgi:hypothetical protein
MPNLQLLTELQQKNFDACPKLSISQKERYFTIDNKILNYINTIRSLTNQVGFLVQLAYFKASGKFFYNKTFPLSDIKYACEILELDEDDIDVSLRQYSPKSRSMHKNYILHYLGWQKFTRARYMELQEELAIHAKQQTHPQSLLPLATRFLISKKIELPPYYVFAEIISTIYNEVEDKLVAIVEGALSKNQKIVLDDLIWIGDKRCKSYKYSALSRIKQFSYSTKIKDIEESIKNYKLLKAFHKKFELVYKKLELSENATQYYSECVDDHQNPLIFGVQISPNLIKLPNNLSLHYF